MKAGLPVTTTAQTVNIVCGSGFDSVNAAARLILTDEAEIVVAGGTESMSQAPFILKNARFGYRMRSPMIDSPLIDTIINDALWDAINDYHMGITAENVAEQWGLTREKLDKYAVESQNKASVAIAEGRFREEIVQVIVKDKKTENIIDMDESPRPGTTIETLTRLKPVFKPDGIVTAGNSSAINDGAAAVVLASEDKVKELGLVPQAEWIDGTLGGVDPAIMGLVPCNI